jgi:hypothetical protein
VRHFYFRVSDWVNSFPPPPSTFSEGGAGSVRDSGSAYSFLLCRAGSRCGFSPASELGNPHHFLEDLARGAVTQRLV